MVPVVSTALIAVLTANVVFTERSVTQSTIVEASEVSWRVLYRCLVVDEERREEERKQREEGL